MTIMHLLSLSVSFWLYVCQFITFLSVCLSVWLCYLVSTVKMIVKIAHDSRAFLGVLLVVTIGFSQAFWLVSNENSALVSATVDGALINAFSFMMGKFV